MRFLEQLRRQLGFLERSCASYDAGFSDEAIRIATSIRVLFHNTPKSTSLLTHLGARTISLMSTVRQADVTRAFAYDGLTTFTGAGPIARLGTHNFLEERPFEDWWNQIVYVSNSYRITRKTLVLTAANKDGGAHVDHSLTPEYQLLTAGFWMEHRGDQGSIPLEGIHLIGLRQVGYEVLHSPKLVALARSNAEL